MVSRLRLAGITAVAVLALFVIALGLRREPEVVPAAGASVHRQLTFTGKEMTPTLSPDGRHIAFVSNEFPHRRVVVQAVDGGESLVLFTGPEASALRWSPDSAELTFWARGEGTDGVYIASRAGGGARRIVQGTPLVTCWSPDGSTIALGLFGSHQIRLINRLGEGQRTISLRGSRGWIWDLDWSPVHDRILFVASDATGRAAIWSIQSDGTGQTKIASANGEISAARWAADGQSVYYFNRVNQTVSVFKTAAARDRETADTDSSPLISGLEGDGSYGLSADASRLVYARAPYHSNLWLVEADSRSVKPTRTTQLTFGTSLVERPAISPDAKSILFNMGYESRANLYTMPATGGTPRQLTFLNAFSVGGVWSPDGRSVAFASTEGGRSRVWLVGVDGGAPRPMSPDDMSDNFNLAWSPGRHLLYQKAGYRNFYAIDPGTQRRQLLFDEKRFVSSPVFSPDGNRIVLFRTGRPADLVVIDATGWKEILSRSLTVPDSNPLPLGWSPDGTAVYVYDGKRAAARGLSVAFGETVTAARILKVPLNGEPITTVLELPFDEVGGIAMSPDARWFVVSVYSSRSDVWLVENFDRAPSSIPSMSARRIP